MPTRLMRLRSLLERLLADRVRVSYQALLLEAEIQDIPEPKLRQHSARRVMGRDLLQLSQDVSSVSRRQYCLSFCILRDV